MHLFTNPANLLNKKMILWTHFSDFKWWHVQSSGASTVWNCWRQHKAKHINGVRLHLCLLLFSYPLTKIYAPSTTTNPPSPSPIKGGVKKRTSIQKENQSGQYRVTLTSPNVLWSIVRLILSTFSTEIRKILKSGRSSSLGHGSEERYQLMS